MSKQRYGKVREGSKWKKAIRFPLPSHPGYGQEPGSQAGGNLNHYRWFLDALRNPAQGRRPQVKLNIPAPGKQTARRVTPAGEAHMAKPPLHTERMRGLQRHHFS